MLQKTVPIKCWIDLETAYRAVSALPPGYPRMMLAHGDPGLGKSTAVDRLHLKNNGIYMVASATWSPRVLLERLADRIGVTVRTRMRTSDILDRILEAIDSGGHGLLVIDEFDRIAHKTSLVELVREVYDLTDIPLVMVGMGNIERTLNDIPQFPQRIGQRVQFGPIDFEDARRVADELCEVDVTDDLVRSIWKRCGGTIRLIVTELAQAELVAAREGVESIGVEQMGVA